MENYKIDYKYQKDFSKEKLIEKLERYAHVAGKQVVYGVLILWNAWKCSTTSLSNKAAIAAALGYFILPFDVVPDFLAGIGYTDDIGVISALLVALSSSLDASIFKQAKEQMKEWGFEITDEEISNFGYEDDKD